MLGLKLATDPRWVNLAEKDIGEILVDHAYCEQKAASNCISLIQSNPEKEYLVDELMPIVTEEWGHFRMVVKEMRKRNIEMGLQRRDHYVRELSNFMVKGGSREDRFLDHLLQAALIEARSCERFRLLSEGISDLELREFYRTLMISEAGHYRLFIKLADHYFDKARVRARWQEWLDHETSVLKNLALRGDRVH